MWKMINTFKIAILFLISQSVNAQWVDLSLDKRAELKRIQMLSDSVGYVNSNEVLYKTEDAALQWDTIFHEDQATIFDYHFIDSQMGYLIKNKNFKNTLMKTSNGGINWTEVGESPYGALFFTNETNGFLSSNSFAIHRTVDGGKSWIDPPGQQPSSAIGDLYFLNDSIGYVAGWYPGGIAKTTDAGKSWIKDYTIDVECYDIFFSDLQTGFIVGWWEAISKTEDSGNSWTRLYYDRSSQISFKAIDCLDNNHCYVVGDSASVYSSSNGSHFSPEPIPVSENLHGVDITDKYCFIVGDNGTVFRKEHNITSTTMESKPQAQISIFPNPTQHLFHIATGSNNIEIEKIELIDISGKLIQQFDSVNHTIDVSIIPSGVYFLSLEYEGNKITKKVVIK